MSKIESCNEELQRQNGILHEQIQTMSTKMAEKLTQAVGDSTAKVSMIEESKSQQQILEVLR